MKNIKIRELISSETTNYYVYCDTAFSHEGDLNYLKNQIDSAIRGEVNGIKFQILLDFKDAYTPNTLLYDNGPSLCFSKEEWLELFEYSKSKGLEVICLPVDHEALNFIKQNLSKIDVIELHAILLNELPLIKKLNNLDIPLILGIGGKTSKEIDFVLNELKKIKYELKKNVILMYGFQTYPTDLNALNLSKLESLKKKYNLTLGYADHTSYDKYKLSFVIIKYAYLYGVRIFEKHIINQRGDKRYDYETAITDQELLELMNELDSFIEILGNNDLDSLNDAELIYKSNEKQLVAKIDLKKGDILTEETIGYKASIEKSDFEQKDFEKLIKKEILRDLKKDEPLKSSHIK